MVEFKKGGYYMPMDRQYYSSEDIAPKLEDPITPISHLGETVPESIGGRNIIQTVQGAIRGGASTLQLVGMRQTPSVVTGPGAFGARYGQEVRQALREVISSAGPEVNIVGIEMPTSMNNFNGMTQRGFSEQARKETLSQVKEAIKFVADINRGGGVDMVAFEFQRPLWKVEEYAGQKGVFDIASEDKFVNIVDERTGELSGFRKTKTQFLPYAKYQGKYVHFDELPDSEKQKYIDKQTGILQPQRFEWNNFVEWSEIENKGKSAPERKAPEELFVEKLNENQIEQSRGVLNQYRQRVLDAERNLERLNRDEEEAKQILSVGNDMQKQIAKNELNRIKIERPQQQQLLEEYRRSEVNQLQGIKEAEEQLGSIRALEHYAPQISAKSYAEAGISALRETQQLAAQGKLKKPLYVGPEIGWPDYYGGHPDEFIQIIKDARGKMVKLLTDPKSEYFDHRIKPDEAKKLADQSIQGTFDTGHLAMWYNHFKANPGESEDARLKRFNKWYLEQVDKISNAGVVGGIQVVDSHSGEHGHLPPGEGIFPVIEATKKFQQKGFKGFIVSEGHDEEAFGAGRIRTKLWERMGGKVGQGYFGQSAGWGHMAPSYFGRTYSPKFMFGSYVPSNDFKLWSEVPLE